MFHSKPLATPRLSFVARWRATAATAVDLLLMWADRAESRRVLMKLDDRQLGDIGVSRFDAVREARKPFWRG